VFKGLIKMNGNGCLNIKGDVKATIEAKKSIVNIGGSCSTVGDINALNVAVTGNLVGNVSCHHLTINEGGSVDGDIDYGIIHIKEGGTLKGAVRKQPYKLQVNGVSLPQSSR